MKLRGCDRRRFGPAEEHSAVDEADERKDDGAERIDVLERVKRDSAEHQGGWIAETIGGPGVSALMDTEGEDENYDLKEDEDDLLIHIC